MRRLLPLLLLLLPFLAMPHAQAATSTVNGVDVAHFDNEAGAIDWSSVRDSGRRFAYVKATQATITKDAYFDANWHDTAAAGLFHGAYHFADPSVGTAVGQADFFAGVIGDQTVPGTLPPVLDLERNGGLSQSALRGWAKAFLDEVQAKTGRVPVLYTNPYNWTTFTGDSTAFGGYRLWEANYTANAQPKAIPGWSTWTFWQHTDSGSVPGMTGGVDLDRFNGSYADLAKLALAGTWGAPTSTVNETASSGTTGCGGYSAITPVRVLDTRSTTGPTSAPTTVTLPASVPVDAVGVQLDVTAVDAAGAGYLRVGPPGATPKTTALNYGAGRGTTGLVTTTADASRQVTITVLGSATDLVVDVLGYFGSGGAQWHPVTPTRVADTRTGQGLPQQPLSGPVDLALDVPSTATGVYLDVTADRPAGNGYVRLGKAGTPPTATALNYDRAGATTGLAVTSTTGGHVTLGVYGAKTDVVVDLLGYFDTASSGGSYCPIPPQRALDTRTGLGASGPGVGGLGLVVPSALPSDAVAVVLDVSASAPQSRGFVRLSTVGVPATTTALNLISGRSVTGLVVVPLSQAEVVIASYAATTHLVLDVIGYLGPPPAAG